jgi:hypothetical protein
MNESTEQWLIMYETMKTNSAAQAQYPAAWGTAKAVHDHYTHEHESTTPYAVVLGIIIVAIILAKQGFFKKP